MNPLLRAHQKALAVHLEGRMSEDVLIVPGGKQTLSPGKALIGHSLLNQALRRLRPLARRRASTWRPFLVAMRARKPCTRLRFRTLG